MVALDSSACREPSLPDPAVRQRWAPRRVEGNGFLPSSASYFGVWSPRQLYYAKRITKSLSMFYQLLGSPLAWKVVLK